MAAERKKVQVALTPVHFISRFEEAELLFYKLFPTQKKDRLIAFNNLEQIL